MLIRIWLFSIMAITFFSEIALSQNFPFPDSNASWRVTYQSNIPHYECYLYYYKGDTVIDNLVYNKLFWSYLDSTSTLIVGGIRTDSNKVYYYKFSTPLPYPVPNLVEMAPGEHLLYDFNIQTGDTLEIDTPLTGPPEFPYVVSRIDSVLIGNGFRNRYWIDGGFSYNGGIWIEGIGSIGGPLGPFLSEFEEWIRLYHFEDSGNVIWYDSLDAIGCVPTTIPLLEESIGIRIYPNPASSNLNIQWIDFMAGEEYEFRIHNVLGHNIVRSKLQVEQKSIDVSRWESGVYFYSVYSEGKVLQGKLLIQ